MRVLGVAPLWDEATAHSFKWYERLKEEIKDKVELRELLKVDANRAKFESEVVSYDPDAIVFYDHGTEDCLCAQEGRGILDMANVSKVAGKVIYTLACLSAARLGVAAYTNYNCIYVGYVREFVFTVEDEQLFSRAVNSGFIAYVNGEGDWAKIKALMIEAFNKAMRETTNPWSRIALSWDRDNLRVYAPNADQPETKCIFRKLALKLLGRKLGWRISRRHALSIILFGAGTGVYVHDRIAEWARLGYRLHGLDIGFILVSAAWIIISFEFVKWLKHYVNPRGALG